jgi:hypothetical protein
LDQYLSEFSATKRYRNETNFVFNRRLPSLYYKIPKRIQCSEATSMLNYKTTFHLYLSFLLMERSYANLKQVFNDAHEVEDTLQSYGKLSEHIQNEELDVEEHEQKAADMNF